MKALPIRLSILLAISAAIVAQAASSPKAKQTAKSKAAEAAAVKADAGSLPAVAVALVSQTPLEIPKSVFVPAASIKEGRDPFFPEQAQAKVPSVTKTPSQQRVTLVLNGITGPPRRMAMINGRTFEAGEKGEVRLPGGSRVGVECLEVRDDSVTILLEGGVRTELRLRSEL